MEGSELRRVGGSLFFDREDLLGKFGQGFGPSLVGKSAKIQQSAKRQGPATFGNQP